MLKLTKIKTIPKQPAMFLQENEVSETQKKVVATQIFVNFHPYLGKLPILTNIFQLGWFNHQLAQTFSNQILRKTLSGWTREDVQKMKVCLG